MGITAEQGKQVIQCAKSYINTPFLHQGRIKGVGVDCAGLIICVNRDVFNSSTDYTNYSPNPNPDVLLSVLSAHTEKIHASDVQDGDIVLFRFAKHPQHFAFIYFNNNLPYIIHAYSTYGKVVEHRLDEKWQRRIVGFYRLKGV